METQAIIVSALVGMITGAITAYITTHLKIKEEREKWAREFPLKFAENQAEGNEKAQRMATQFAIGFLVFVDPETNERQKIFVPPHCRLIAGRNPENEIHINEVMLSRKHCAFAADEKKVYVELLEGRTPIYKNGEALSGRAELKSGDTIALGPTLITYHQLAGA